MSDTVYKYRVWCVTENSWVTAWNTDEPQTCPNNNTHTIDTNATTILSEVSSNEQTIKQEEIPTGGHYRCHSECITAAASVTTTKDVVYPHPVSVLAVHFHTETPNDGDILSVHVGPDTTVGALTANVTTGDTVLPVSSTVLQYTEVGYHITLDTEELGCVCSKDLVNGTITVANAISQNHNAGTLVKQTVRVIDGLHLVGDKSYQLGSVTLSSSHVPTGTIIRILYENKEAEQKRFIGVVELLY